MGFAALNPSYQASIIRPFPQSPASGSISQSQRLEARMRVRLSVAALAALIVGVVGVTAWTGGAAAPRAKLFADNRPGAIPVDTELVLAVDVSYSMDPEEQQLQREGYIEALTSREFMQALRNGVHAKVAV